MIRTVLSCSPHRILAALYLPSNISFVVANNCPLIAVNSQRSPKSSFSTIPKKDHQKSESAMMSVSSAINPDAYPDIPRDTSIIDDYNGIKVADPYRALEDPDSSITKKFVDELNAISRPFLDASKVRDKLTKKLTKLWDYEKFGCFSRHGDYYYHYHNTGLQNQWVYYRQKELNGERVVFLDPNIFSEDGTTSLGSTCWTDDGKIFAYGLREKGSDWTTIRFRDSAGNDLPDVVIGARFGSVDWLSDNSGIFYSKYPHVDESQMHGGCTLKLENHSLYFHKLGTECAEDVLVAQFPENKNALVSGYVTEDGRFLIVSERAGCSPENCVYYFDLAAVGNKITGRLALKPLFTKANAAYDIIENDGESALVHTNHNASMYKLIRVKLDGGDWDASEKWETFIAEDPRRMLSWAAPVANDKLIVAYVEDVKVALYVHDLKSGKLLHAIPIDIGSVCGTFMRKRYSEFFIAFYSYLVPMIIYRGDFSTADNNRSVELEEIRRVRIAGIDFDRMKLEQVFYASKDGTKVPMYIVSRKDAKRDGSNAMLLHGYGGFNVSYLPDFSVSRLCLIQHFGASYAIANLRGGDEYGEDWHRAGILSKKQNVFDDFIAAAEYLIANKYTSPKRLAIQGGSNGGLLMAACSQQRPDLFGAVINNVGVLDMLRFHKFTIGSAWISEYGNPDKAEDFEYIYKYSPLHNLHLENGQQFPATLLLTADHDDRVVPSHTLKYIAQLYHLLKTEATWQRNPILARIDVKAGHGGGKPTSKVIAECVDVYCFLERVLNLEWKDK